MSKFILGAAALTGVAGFGNGNSCPCVGSGDVDLSADYDTKDPIGTSCATWDADFAFSCQGADAPAYCGQPWYHSHKLRAYFPTINSFLRRQQQPSTTSGATWTQATAPARLLSTRASPTAVLHTTVFFLFSVCLHVRRGHFPAKPTHTV